MNRAVMANRPRRISGQPWLRNTSYVDGHLARMGLTRVSGVIRSLMLIDSQC